MLPQAACLVNLCKGCQKKTFFAKRGTFRKANFLFQPFSQKGWRKTFFFLRTFSRKAIFPRFPILPARQNGPIQAAFEKAGETCCVQQQLLESGFCVSKKSSCKAIFRQPFQKVHGKQQPFWHSLLGGQPANHCWKSSTKTSFTNPIAGIQPTAFPWISLALIGNNVMQEHSGEPATTRPQSWSKMGFLMESPLVKK